MASVVYILFFLSIPVFYIYGLIKFIKGNKSSPPPISNPPAPDQRQQLIQQLQSLPPDTTIASALTHLNSQTPPPPSPTTPAPQPDNPLPSPTPTPISATSFNFSNWYTDHSINALLYLGAFLIVTSASIFVSFQWQTFDNTFKAILITLFTLAWLIFGSWFYSLPKVKSAGLTFIIIGCLLIPFTGFAWHNFVFSHLGYNLGHTWFITSAIALLTYLFFSKFTASPLFTYLWSSAILSASLSLTNVFELDPTFYSLSAAFSGLLLVITHLVTTPRSSTNWPPVSLEYALLTTTLCSIFVGLKYLLPTGDFYIFESVVTLTLITSSFGLLYLFSFQASHLTATIISTLATLICLFNYFQLPSLTISYLMDASSLVLVIIALNLFRSRYQTHYQATLIIAVFTAISVYIHSLSNHQPLISAGFVAYLSFLFYLIARLFRLQPALYAANLGFYLLLYHLTTDLPDADILRPLLYISLNTLWYLIYRFQPHHRLSPYFLHTSIIGSIITGIFFHNLYQLLYHPPLLQAASYLATAYAATIILTSHAFFTRSTSLKYLASASALLSLLWHLQVLGIENAQAYTLPTAIYLLVIARLRLQAKDLPLAHLLDLLGLSTTILPTFIQTFPPPHGHLYALWLGIQGLIFVFLGNSLHHSRYSYAGILAIILAVLTQTYDYLLSLPRWLITGSIGLTIIGLAVFLLLRRQEPRSHTPTQPPNPLPPTQ